MVYLGGFALVLTIKQVTRQNWPKLNLANRLLPKRPKIQVPQHGHVKTRKRSKCPVLYTLRHAALRTLCAVPRLVIFYPLRLVIFCPVRWHTPCFSLFGMFVAFRNLRASLRSRHFVLGALSVQLFLPIAQSLGSAIFVSRDAKPKPCHHMNRVPLYNHVN